MFNITGSEFFAWICEFFEIWIFDIAGIVQSVSEIFKKMTKLQQDENNNQEPPEDYCDKMYSK